MQHHDVVQYRPAIKKQFVYGPLSKERQEIRLLSIKRSPLRGLVEVAIKHVSLSEKPVFQALSYRWGHDLSRRYTIKLSYVSKTAPDDFEVYGNLHDFLEMLANHNAEVYDWLWIDQICVNQSDRVEKDWQIALMSEIYSSAKSVLVWLGLAFPGSDDLMVQINHIVASRNRDFWQTVSDVEVLKVLTGFRSHESAFQQLLQLEYWTRVWICQEIVLGEQTWVMLGAKRALWSQLCHLIDACREWPDLVLNNEHMIRNQRGLRYVYGLVEMCGLKESWRDSDNHKGLGWKSVLALTYDRDCKNISDKVYGVMALVQRSLRVEPVSAEIPKALFYQVLRKAVHGDINLEMNEKGQVTRYLDRDYQGLHGIFVQNLCVSYYLRHVLGLKDEMGCLRLPEILLEVIDEALYPRLTTTEKLLWRGIAVLELRRANRLQGHDQDFWTMPAVAMIKEDLKRPRLSWLNR